MAPSDPSEPQGSEPAPRSDAPVPPSEGAEAITVTSTARFEDAPQSIGPYRLLETIGEGGMGTVYLAEQERPIRRRVALKLIKLGMDTREVVARFEAERQALALMDHPSIAKVFDAGATELGRPYFVMEHVPGEPITDYCDRHRLSVAERLRLVAQVCNAVQHAHQKAIIHRDLKPSNVLVTVQDGTPVPKVIDFGVAKAMAHRLTERTVFTELGHLIGTPEYMSPEQAEMTGLNVDTRTDIYSLGVMLYELLVGDRPFDARTLREAGLDGLQRTIREKDPERPSTRVSHLGPRASGAAERRRATVPALRRQLRNELDWITMRALEKDRTRRYQTASELAADIERYLRDEPVLASPPGQLYRLRKYVRRHKAPVAAAAAVLIAFVTFGSVSLWQGERAKAQGLAARANAVLATAASVEDPLVKALLVRELDGLPGLTMEQFSRAQTVLDAPLPVAVVGIEEEPLAWDPSLSTGPFAAAVSPDGSRVVIGSGDGSARVWRADGGSAPVVLRGHKGPLSYVGFSPDGTHIVTCSWDRTAGLWRAEGGEPVVLRGHDGAVLRASFSRDGRRLVTASFDGTARIWPVDGAGAPIVLRGHADVVRDASFSPDGTRIVTASDDRTARVWRADGVGKAIVLEGHEGPVSGAAFSPDGDRVVTASDDRTARVWRADGTGKAIVLKGHDGRVTSAAFSADARLVLTASEDRTARVWSADGTGDPRVLEGHEREVWWAGFSPTGSRILTVSEDKTARVWEPSPVSRTEFGNVMQIRPAEPFRGKKVRFRAKVRFDAAGGPGRAQLWVRVDLPKGKGFFDNMGDRPITSDQWREYQIVGDVAEDAVNIALGMMLFGSGRAWMDAASLELSDGQPVPGGRLSNGGFESAHLQWGVPTEGYTAKAVAENPAEGRLCVRLERAPETAYRSTVVARQSRGIRAGAFLLSGERLLTSSNDGIARLWRTDGGGDSNAFRGHESSVYSAAFSPDGERIVTASSDHTARVWRTDGTVPPVVLRGQKESVYDAQFSPDGAFIVTASDDRNARVWRADGTGEPVILRGHEGSVNAAAFSPDGKRIVTASRDGTARVWRADGTGEPVVLRHERLVTSAAFDPEGERIVTASEDGMARVWRADGTGQPVVFRHEARVNSASFSPDGKRIVTASSDRTARLWRADGTGQPVILRHEAPVGAAAFSPDGERIVTVPLDRTVRVWRADGTGQPVVLRHEDFPVSAAFSPDGERIVTASLEGNVRVWPATWQGLFRYQLGKVSLCLGPDERVRYLGESRAQAQATYADCEKRFGRDPRASERRPG